MNRSFSLAIRLFIYLLVACCVITILYLVTQDSAPVLTHDIVSAVLVALFAGFLLLLERMVRSVEQGDPFILANARRLRGMGICLLIPAAMMLAENLFTSRGNVEQGIVLIMLAIFVFAFLILGQVFREGVVMREDLEGTV